MIVFIVKAVEQGHNVVGYVWPYKQEDGTIQYHDYECDLGTMFQTNCITGARRAIRECGQTPCEDMKTVWQFVVDDRYGRTVWKDMDEEFGNLLTHQPPVDYEWNQYVYHLDDRMVQVNRSTSKRRLIRKILVRKSEHY